LKGLMIASTFFMGRRSPSIARVGLARILRPRKFAKI